MPLKNKVMYAGVTVTAFTAMYALLRNPMRLSLLHPTAASALKLAYMSGVGAVMLCVAAPGALRGLLMTHPGNKCQPFLDLVLQQMGACLSFALFALYQAPQLASSAHWLCTGLFTVKMQLLLTCNEASLPIPMWFHLFERVALAVIGMMTLIY
jgi:hypothetical protein